MVSFCFAIIEAQTDTIASLTFSGYGEVYYQYDFGKPDDHERPGFLYNHKRHNEVNINLAFAKAAYASQKTRANFALMVGNYAQYNLAAEPTWAQFVFEANAGVKLSKKQNLWLDAGIMPSHIGFESAIGADCWTLTRSLVAENSPYFGTGAKLSFLNKKENLTVAALLLNGWQRTHRPDGYQKPAVGLQLNYKPTDQLTLNYSNFIGSEGLDGEGARRDYHNFYAIWESSMGIGIIAGMDFGKQEDFGEWIAPVMILRWRLAPKWLLANRFEYFKDPNQVVAGTGTENGANIFGTSLNLDFSPSENTKIRLEARQLQSKDAIFPKEGGLVEGNFAMVAALCMKL